MAAALKFFTFFVLNEATKEIATLIGQGTTLEEAWKDGIGIATSAWRPNSNGQTNDYSNKILSLNVRLPDGRIVSRPKAEFESDKPFAEGAPS